jgi:hypothetical protein
MGNASERIIECETHGSLTVDGCEASLGPGDECRQVAYLKVPAGRVTMEAIAPIVDRAAHTFHLGHDEFYEPGKGPCPLSVVTAEAVVAWINGEA